MAESVFYDIADSADEAANLTARSLLMIAIEQRIREIGWTQAEAARELGVQQPRVSDLMTGKIAKFSLDALVNMLPAVGLTFNVERVDATRGKSAKRVPPSPARDVGLAAAPTQYTNVKPAPGEHRIKGRKAVASGRRKASQSTKR